MEHLFTAMEIENNGHVNPEPLDQEPRQEELPLEPAAKEWTIVAQAEDLKDGGSKAVIVAGNDIALFRKGEEFYAVANECSHYGAPLCGGYVTGHTVMCPWHGWQFDMNTGECLSVPGCDIEAFQVKVEDGAVKVAVG